MVFQNYYRLLLQLRRSILLNDAQFVKCGFKKEEIIAMIVFQVSVLLWMEMKESRKVE